MLLLVLGAAALRFCVVVVSVVELVERVVDWHPASTASERLSKITGLVILRGMRFPRN